MANFLENIKLPDGTLLTVNAVPAGGNIGQVLVKTGVDETEFDWGDVDLTSINNQIEELDNVDKALAQTTANEVARAKEVEAELAQAVADEKARAEVKEGELVEAIEAEKTAREAKDAELVGADEANATAIADLNGVVTISKADLVGLIARLGDLEKRVSGIGKNNIITETVEAPEEGEEAPVFNDETADFVISGTITEVETAQIIAKSLELNDTKVENNVRLNINTTGDVTITGSEWNGSFPKANGGNEVASIHSDGYVVIKDSVVDAEDAYNGIGIGLGTGVAKSILIDNVDFKGTFSNNTICIYGTADNATVTISNCHFNKVSNAIRFSNRLGGKVTLNIINCTVDEWDTSEYAGFILFQDYTSGGKEAGEANNLFGPDKITLNITNLTGPNGKVVATNPADISGTKDPENQVIYVYVDKDGFITYDETRYPKLNIQ